MKRDTAYNFQGIGLAGLGESDRDLKDMDFLQEEIDDMINEIKKLKVLKEED